MCRTGGAYPPAPPVPIQEVINNPASASLAPFIFGRNGFGGGKKEKEKRGLWERVRGRKLREEDEKGGKEDDLEGELRAVGGVLEELEKGEKKRALKQIEKAMGYVDLGDIVKVESAGEAGWVDVEDEGGEEGLEEVEDKVGMRRRRSFVMSLSNGVEVTFEVREPPSTFSLASELILTKEWISVTRSHSRWNGLADLPRSRLTGGAVLESTRSTKWNTLPSVPPPSSDSLATLATPFPPIQHSTVPPLSSPRSFTGVS